MKKIKHFLGWLFRYCPYGHGCPPEHPFRPSDEEYGGSNSINGGAGGGC